MAFTERCSDDWADYRAMKKSRFAKDMVTVRLWTLDYHDIRDNNRELFDNWNGHYHNGYTPTDEEKPLWDKLEYIHSYHGVDFDFASTHGEFKFEYYEPKYETEMEYDGTEESIERIYDYFIHQGNVWVGEVIQAGNDFWYIDTMGFTNVSNTFSGKLSKSAVRKYSLEDELYERQVEAAEALRGLELLGKLKAEMSQLYDGYRLAECGNLIEKFADEFGGWAYPNGPVKSNLMEIRRELFEMEGKAQELYHSFDKMVDEIESTLTDTSKLL